MYQTYPRLALVHILLEKVSYVLLHGLEKRILSYLASGIDFRTLQFSTAEKFNLSTQTG